VVVFESSTGKKFKLNEKIKISDSGDAQLLLEAILGSGHVVYK